MRIPNDRARAPSNPATEGKETVNQSRGVAAAIFAAGIYAWVRFLMRAFGTRTHPPLAIHHLAVGAIDFA
jgi:hypothetical protein